MFFYVHHLSTISGICRFEYCLCCMVPKPKIFLERNWENPKFKFLEIRFMQNIDYTIQTKNVKYDYVANDIFRSVSSYLSRQSRVSKNVKISLLPRCAIYLERWWHFFLLFDFFCTSDFLTFWVILTSRAQQLQHHWLFKIRSNMSPTTRVVF